MSCLNPFSLNQSLKAMQGSCIGVKNDEGKGSDKKCHVPAFLIRYKLVNPSNTSVFPNQSTCSTTITGASSFSRHWAARHAALRASFTWDNHLELGFTCDVVIWLGTLYWPVLTATCHYWHRCMQLSAPSGSLSAPEDQAVWPPLSSTCTVKKRYKIREILYDFSVCLCGSHAGKPGVASFHVSLSSFSLFSRLHKDEFVYTIATLLQH